MVEERHAHTQHLGLRAGEPPRLAHSLFVHRLERLPLDAAAAVRPGAPGE